jgi:16S rRNA (adenine1518-N6/adenine1519-N6)-dimethyltransferase
VKRQVLRQLLQSAGIRPTRGKGQNFLLEENLAQAVARDGGIEPGDLVLEIGTGVGLLTGYLLGEVSQGGEVVSVEKDTRVLEVARGQLGQPEQLTLLEMDALAKKSQLNPLLLEALRERLAPGRALRIVANLPYSVATPLVIGLLAADLPLVRMVVMVQLEVAQRFGATPADELYGATSVLCAALCDEVSILRRVPPEVFCPRPKVQSAIVGFAPRPDRQAGFQDLCDVVRALFNYRRKGLRQATKAVTRRSPELGWLLGAIERAAIDPTRRPDDLALSDYQSLVQQKP